MKIELEKLLLYEDNPRLSHAFSEMESITSMIVDQGNRLVTLAESIIENGLNPLNKIGAFPSKEYEGFYCVGEGNRRVCVLKLITNPNLCKDISESLFKKFSDLSLRYSVPKEIEVETFEDFDSMRNWIETIHMGEQGGKGVVKWNSIQKQRFDKQVNGKSLFLDFFEWIESNNILTKEEINAVTQTNWQRVLRKKYFDFLCISIRNEQFVVNDGEFELFSLRIKEVQKNLAGKTVSIVYDNDKLEKFFNDICYGLYQCNLDELSFKKLTGPFEGNNSDNPNDDSGFFEENDNTDNKQINKDDSEDNETVTDNHGNKIKDTFGNRKTIIPYSFTIKSASTKINKIISELKRLKVDEYPNACAALLRLLFELSSKHYIELETNSDQTKTQFEQIIRLAANDLRNKGKLSDNAHSKLMKDVDIMREMFNDDMHAVNTFPSIEGLKAFFTAHHAFLKKCLEVK